MKKYILTFALSSLLLTSSMAQRTPALSQGATVVQTIGITDFTIKYSRPVIKGRKVFSDSSALAPLNQLWRTGANSPTTFEATTEFSFGGRTVPAGKYALLSIPSGTAWTVILNKKYDQGTDAYSEADDVARVKVVPTSSEYNEAFKIDMTPLSDSTAYLNLAWSSVNVAIPISLHTESLTMNALNKAIAEKPEDVATLESGAGFLLNKGKDLQVALSLADKAIGLKEGYYNLWLKASILSKLGKYNEALPVAQKALTLGTPSDQAFSSFFKGQIEKTIAEIQPKVTPKAAVTPVLKGKKKKK
jgi:tetratricopeptide (TPR) repeat protein